MELRAAGGGPRHVEPPWLDGVDVNSPHDALRIGVGAGYQVERFVFWRVDVLSIGGSESPVVPGNRGTQSRLQCPVDVAQRTDVAPHPAQQNRTFDCRDDRRS